MKRCYLTVLLLFITMFLMIAFNGCGSIGDTQTIETTTAVTLCPTNPIEPITYELFSENNKHFIRVTPISEDTDSSISTGSPIPIAFSSFSEMKAAILDCKLTDSQLVQLAAHCRTQGDRENGIYDICNIEDLQMPIFPKGVKAENFIEWTVTRYELLFHLIDQSEQNMGGPYGYFCVRTEQEMYWTMKHYYEIFEEGEFTKESEKTLDDRNATEIIYNGGANKTIRYTLTVNGVEMLVDESYTLWMNANVPQSVKMYGIKDSQCFEYSFYDLTERPSVEFLSSFGIQDVPHLSSSQ